MSNFALKFIEEPTVLGVQKYPKFIIENDVLKIHRVKAHRELLDDEKIKAKCVGGGWWQLIPKEQTIVFTGDSWELGKATPEQIKKCLEESNVTIAGQKVTNINELFKGYRFVHRNEVHEDTLLIQF